MGVLYIPPGTDVNGPTQTAQSIWVDGTVNGDLRTEDKIIISEKATIHGVVWAQSAKVGGAVEGGMKVSGSLLLEATARIQGDIAADRLRVEEGAQFTGDCRMDTLDRIAEPDIPPPGGPGDGSETEALDLVMELTG